MKIIFDLDINKCSACGACAIACMDQNDIDILQNEDPFRVVTSIESEGKSEKGCSFISIACNHCTDAPCILACPSGCIKKDESTDLTIYDSTSCIGCHSCAMACPFGAPSFDSEGKMHKCDGCNTRVLNSLDPACVRTCPTKALTCISEDEYKKIKISKSMRKIMDQI